MPTPFEETGRPESSVLNGAAPTPSLQSRRSIFTNYRREEHPPVGQPAAQDSLASRSPHEIVPTELPNGDVLAGVPAQCQGPEKSMDASAGRQPAGIDVAVARSFIHAFLARAFQDPTTEIWRWLTDPETVRPFHLAAAVLGQGLPEEAKALVDGLGSGTFDAHYSAYLAVFGHAARGSCPLNEIEYGDLNTDPLFQPHRLADLAAFYRAFGLEIAADADERQDHLCLELEFMSFLAAKEAYAMEHRHTPEELALCRDAPKKFLRAHLGRWAPAFARRLAAMAGDSSLGALARFTGAFVAAECAHFGVPAGNEDLLLRPVDEAAETLCASCGIPSSLPGAVPAPSA